MTQFTSKSGEKYIVVLPLAVKSTKTKKTACNLNVYRNLSFYTLNTQKKNFKEIVRSQIEKLPQFHRITIQFIIYKSSKRSFDISNVASILDKYFSDALVDFHKLKDDSYQYIPQITYCFGGIDKTKPDHAIAIITEIKDNSMLIQLDKTDLEQAVRTYLTNQNIQNVESLTFDLKKELVTVKTNSATKTAKPNPEPEVEAPKADPTPLFDDTSSIFDT